MSGTINGNITAGKIDASRITAGKVEFDLDRLLSTEEGRREWAAFCAICALMSAKPVPTPWYQQAWNAVKGALTKG